MPGGKTVYGKQFPTIPAGIKRVALVGAGGVGKTTQMKLFAAKGFMTFPSITREYYKSCGIKDESEYMKLSKGEQLVFQAGMRNYYTFRYDAFLAENHDVDTITDRSIFDHLAYGIYGLEDQFTLAGLKMLVNACIEYANEDKYTNLVFFPYPQKWMMGKSIEDGFRNIDAAKNYAVSSIMFNTLFYNKVVHKRIKAQLSLLLDDEEDPNRIYQAINMALYAPSAVEM
jgi:predicted ATPase